MLIDNRVFEPYTIELNNPLTDEQWDILDDVDFDHTEHICFHTKHGKEVHFYKNAIPIAWIEKRLQRAVAFTHSKAEGNIIDDGCVVTVVSASFTANVLVNLLEDWEKENGRSE